MIVQILINPPLFIPGMRRLGGYEVIRSQVSIKTISSSLILGRTHLSVSSLSGSCEFVKPTFSLQKGSRPRPLSCHVGIMQKIPQENIRKWKYPNGHVH